MLRETADGDDVIAVRLTQGAAQAIAAQTPGARWERFHASKEDQLTEQEAERLAWEDERAA